MNIFIFGERDLLKKKKKKSDLNSWSKSVNQGIYFAILISAIWKNNDFICSKIASNLQDWTNYYTYSYKFVLFFLSQLWYAFTYIFSFCCSSVIQTTWFLVLMILNLSPMFTCLPLSWFRCLFGIRIYE